jgi:hypothetical protein
MKTPPNDPLGQIPQEHPWFQAVIGLVREMRSESEPGLLTAPGPTVTNDTRNYDAGRVAMARDIEVRLRRRQRLSERPGEP